MQRIKEMYRHGQYAMNNKLCEDTRKQRKTIISIRIINFFEIIGMSIETQVGLIRVKAF